MKVTSHPYGIVMPKSSIGIGSKFWLEGRAKQLFYLFYASSDTLQGRRKQFLSGQAMIKTWLL